MDNICSKLDEQINKIANTPFENKKFKVLILLFSKFKFSLLKFLYNFFLNFINSLPRVFF